jgi:hypothetical protein
MTDFGETHLKPRLPGVPGGYERTRGRSSKFSHARLNRRERRERRGKAKFLMLISVRAWKRRAVLRTAQRRQQPRRRKLVHPVDSRNSLKNQKKQGSDSDLRSGMEALASTRKSA